MDGDALDGKGFGEWIRFTLECSDDILGKLPSDPGLYVVKLDKSIPRFQGASDIVYIGSTPGGQDLKGRASEYLHPGDAASPPRMNEFLKMTYPFELSFKVLADEGERVALHEELLGLYEMEHLELPPLN